jgi:hypothetical protein
MRIGYARVSDKTTIPLFRLAADPAVAIRINLVQSRCNRSVERSRYAESLSDEREQ